MSLEVLPSPARFFPDFTAGDSAAPSFFFRLVKTNDCFSESSEESVLEFTAAEGDFRVLEEGTVTGSLGLLSSEEDLKISSEELSTSLEEAVAGLSKGAIGFSSFRFSGMSTKWELKGQF